MPIIHGMIAMNEKNRKAVLFALLIESTASFLSFDRSRATSQRLLDVPQWR
ncbi:hypothetical protein PWR63_08710 [Paraburkholderia sp. A2WS-5]|uniref:hypothetical protein n=1 Tax=unclassified Paraburkholderia TaxID=2615204 RepID=UPI003B7A7AFC